MHQFSFLALIPLISAIGASAGRCNNTKPSGGSTTYASVPAINPAAAVEYKKAVSPRYRCLEDRLLRFVGRRRKEMSDVLYCMSRGRILWPWIETTAIDFIKCTDQCYYEQPGQSFRPHFLPYEHGKEENRTIEFLYRMADAELNLSFRSRCAGTLYRLSRRFFHTEPSRR